MECKPRFGYGSEPASLERRKLGEAVAEGATGPACC